MAARNFESQPTRSAHFPQAHAARIMRDMLLAALLLAATATGLAGCASGSSGGSGSSAGVTSGTITPLPTTTGTGGTPATPNGTGPSSNSGSTGGSAPYASGSTVALNSNAASFSDFFAPRTVVESPINIQININMATTFDPVIIGYDMPTGPGFERALGTQNPGSSYQNAQYNGWYTINGQTVWKGFFQDAYGAIVLILDPNGASTTGDGQSAGVSGSVYYQNFVTGYPYNPYQGPDLMCWQITAGDHDCRTFLIGGSVNMGSSLDPNPSDHGPDVSIGYQELGTFVGINRSLADF